MRAFNREPPFRFCKMASKEGDENTQDLNSILKTMGERGEEGELWKKYTEHCLFFFSQLVSETFSQSFDNCMILQTYGSAAEDLKSLAPDDVGDLDIVICPKSDDLMIHDEMIEYSENPMHVKIKGADHPVLRSCLVQGTDYVATSALKNFHSAIYGSSAPLLVNLAIRALEISSREKWATNVWQWKNNEYCPALQLDFTQSIGLISKEIEQLKNPQALQNIDFAEWEWLAHACCKSSGSKYSKEHANVFKELIEFANEVKMSYYEKGLLCQPEAFPLLIQDLVSSERVKNFRDRVREIESRTQNESGRRDDDLEEAADRKRKQYATPESCHDNGSGRSEEIVSEGTLRTKEESSVTAENDENQRSSEVFTSTSSQETFAKILQNFDKSPGNQTPKQSTEQNENGNEKSGQKKDGHEKPKSESQSEPNAEQQPSAVEPDPSRVVVPERNPNDGYEDLKSISKKRDFIAEHIFKPVTEEAKHAPNSTVSPKAPIAGGYDLVPALRSPGWPQVALEWIKRERKWPSPDTVHKVVQDGFHLVVKPPKKGGNPECDFRISFSHAEYLLSYEMNDVQRECYRCLKKYHRAHLKEPKGLVTFHLKNIFLQTIEETGAELWTESNRAECVMKLFGNLLESLIEKNLRHFFVNSYNLFCEDYIESPEILDALAEKVVEIMEDPKKIAKSIQSEEAAKLATKERFVPLGETARQKHGEMEAPSTSGNDDSQSSLQLSTVPMEMGATHQGRSSNTSYSFHDLKDVYLATGQELIDKAFNDDHILDVSDALEMSLVEDLKEMTIKHNMQTEDFLKVFEACWGLVYLTVSKL